MKTRRLLFFSFILTAHWAFTQAPTVELQRQYFNFRDMAFDIVVSNSADADLILEKVGLQYRAFPPDYLPIIIGGEEITLQSSARFQIPLEIQISPHYLPVELKASPPLILRAGERIRFGLGLSTVLEATSLFKMDLVPVLEFSDGARLRGEPLALTDSDFKLKAQGIPDNASLQQAFSGRATDVNPAEALRALPFSGLSQQAITRLLQPYLTEDSEPFYRKVAIEVAGRLRMKQFMNFIRRRLETSTDADEIQSAALALHQMDPRATIGVLMRRLSRETAPTIIEGLALGAGRLQIEEAASTLFMKFTRLPLKSNDGKLLSALQMLEVEEIADWNYKILGKRSAWITGSPEKLARFTSHCLLAIHYAHQKSLPFIQQGLSNSDLVASLLPTLEAGARLNGRSGLLFAGGLRKEYTSLLRHDNFPVRQHAISLLGLTEEDLPLLTKIMLLGLKDKVVSVRLKAAEWVGKKKLVGLSGMVQRLYENATEEKEKAVYCEALRNLGLECRP